MRELCEALAAVLVMTGSVMTGAGAGAVRGVRGGAALGGGRDGGGDKGPGIIDG